jgi:hypothetical protein
MSTAAEKELGGRVQGSEHSDETTDMTGKLGLLLRDNAEEVPNDDSAKMTTRTIV